MTSTTSPASPASIVFETVAPGSVAYLDRLAATDLGRLYKGRMLDALDVRTGQTVLDIGCGPGTDLGALADAVSGTGTGPRTTEGTGSRTAAGTDTAARTASGSAPARSPGAVIGVDHDQVAVDTARERTAGRDTVTVHLGDVHELPLADGSVDRARTDRVLQHVADPVRALCEAHRVLRPGGRLVLGEPDWDTLTVDHPDEELSRAYTRYVTDEVIRNARIGRQLPRLAAEAGFTVPTVVPVTPAFRDVGAADKVLGLERTTRRALAAGYFTVGGARRWLDHLASGPFLAAVTFYIVVAQA
ncbi:methyltransferase domain-containing protein [Streptomyces sp. CBMA29]|uniref:methyltransferase domain-containing protein n=1 Tax=Streptomyces sp. CBMA29 TaxID=1896314 RepID=UPI001661A877|nr:methyltransferase domain-containing protein [Streptomyces sp. CBMA29]MBD0740419.1 ubiquinone biosynthesis protein UbiE [Streptomyces sp. CBMA29]